MEQNALSNNETRFSRTLRLRQARFAGPQLARDRASRIFSGSVNDGEYHEESNGKVSPDTGRKRHLAAEITQAPCDNPPKPTTKTMTSHLRNITDVLNTPRAHSGILEALDDNDCSLVTSGLQSSRCSRRQHQRIRSKASMARRSFSGETTRYIEYLESQLAASQTQLQHLTSPTSIETQSARLRALNAENRMLQQELTEWENKFAERLQDQLEHYEKIIAHMRGRMSDLETMDADRNTRSKELEMALETKVQDLQAAEGANRELERRLEFVSNLVAISPGKPSVPVSAQPRHVRQRSSFSLRKSIASSLVSPTQGSFDPTALGSSQTIGLPVSGPTAPSMSRSSSNNTTNAESIPDSMRDSGYLTDVTVEFSDVRSGLDTNSEAAPTPSRRSSLPRSALNDIESGLPKTGKPVRRMRRFYAGSARQSLILPSTTNVVESQPASAVDDGSPMGFQPSASNSVFSSPSFEATESTPKARTHQSLPLEGVPAHHHKRGVEDRRRSSTWSEDSTSNAEQRKRAVQETLHHLVTPSTESSSSADSCLQGWSTRHSTHRNLFEELSSLKQERGPSRPSLDSNNTLTQRDEPIHAPHQNTDVAVSDRSSLTEPNEEVQTDLADHVPPPLSPLIPRHLVSQSTAQQGRQPLSRFFSHPVASAKCFVTNSLSTITISRPVLEFRMWLIRLLLGRLRSRHGTLLILRPPPSPSTGSATSPVTPPVGPSASDELNLNSSLSQHIHGTRKGRQEGVEPTRPLTFTRYSEPCIEAAVPVHREGKHDFFMSNEHDEHLQGKHALHFDLQHVPNGPKVQHGDVVLATIPGSETVQGSVLDGSASSCPCRCDVQAPLAAKHANVNGNAALAADAETNENVALSGSQLGTSGAAISGLSQAACVSAVRNHCRNGCVLAGCRCASCGCATAAALQTGKVGKDVAKSTASLRNWLRLSWRLMWMLGVAMLDGPGSLLERT